MEISSVVNFTISSSDEWKRTFTAFGDVKMSADGPFFKVKGGFEEMLGLSDELLYNINFHSNRTAYQLQHKAMDWFEKHNLFNILVGNEQFANRADSCYSTLHQNYKFR